MYGKKNVNNEGKKKITISRIDENQHYHGLTTIKRKHKQKASHDQERKRKNFT